MSDSRWVAGSLGLDLVGIPYSKCVSLALRTSSKALKPKQNALLRVKVPHGRIKSFLKLKVLVGGRYGWQALKPDPTRHSH